MGVSFQSVFKSAVQGETEFGGKAYCPQYPQIVFVETTNRISDCAENAALKIVNTVVEIQQFIRFKVIHHGVDGEIPSLGIKGKIGGV